MRCIHYEVCRGKQTSIGNGSSVMAYNAASVLVVVLVHSSRWVQHMMMTDHQGSFDFEVLFEVPYQDLPFYVHFEL